MNKKEFYDKFKNMEPMKYYEGDTNSVKAKAMLNNEGDKYFAMRKYDGEWSRVIIMEDGVLIQSRSVSKITGTYGDKTELVPHLTEELKNKWSPGTVLLGELAFDDYESTSREVGAILRCKAPKAIERQKDKKIKLFVFDVLAYGYVDMTNWEFEKRFLVYPEYQNSVYFQPVMNDDGENSDFMGFAEWVWERGGEGIMIVRKDMKYAPGKRTAWMSLKVKKKLGTLEAQVVDFIEPNRIYEGSEIETWKFFVDSNDKPADLTKMIDYGSLTAVTKPYFYDWKNGVVVNYNGNVIKVTSGLTDQMREWLATDQAAELMQRGKLFAKITGMEMTEDSIRHPIFLDIVKY